jgi:DNA repair exonuclease SbcCD ATPase subunit
MASRDFERVLDRHKGKLQHVRESLAASRADLAKYEALLPSIEEAQEIIQRVAKDTQNNFVCRIADVVSMALDAVFGSDAYEFSLEFVQKRGKTEVEIAFVRDGSKIDPLSASGGGAVDVASFALRVAVWSLLKNSGRPVLDTIILDEPFRFLSRDLQPLAGAMLKTLSKKMGLQFVMVTHNQDLIDCADAVFEVTNKNGESHVTRLEETA